MEILFHLCNNERIKKSAKQFFPEDENLQKCFLEIDRKNFEMDIRKFLNLINSMFKNVYSVVVDYVTIDQFKLIGKACSHILFFLDVIDFSTVFRMHHFLKGVI